MKLENIDDLIDGNGQVTLGAIGPVQCAAVATDGTQALAMLVRREGESLAALLRRLDKAIEDALEGDVFVDEING
jgi:hypothetical protein